VLFNSYAFLFGFMPVTLAVFVWLSRRQSARLSMTWLVAASLFFYGWWEPRYLALLLGSATANYLVALRLGRPGAAHGKAVLVVGVTGNLVAIGVFKYLHFFAGGVERLLAADFGLPPIVLPLAISFFTFQQIAYLLDCHRDPARVEPRFLHYLFFVSFFPQLIAGPIVHHSEIMPQIARRSAFRVHAENLAVGSSIFVAGLFKKVVLADGLAPYATPVFDAALAGASPTGAEAWLAAVAYSLQLYFDFSGYSDMAIGLARLFGIHLPLNFDSPYKATNIIEFWRRWHMTLSRFLRDCLYIPLGGNRKGANRRYANLMVTMLLGGLWHGAAWTFVIWGGLHGLYLLANHGFRAFRRRVAAPTGARGSHAGRLAGRVLTLLSVVTAWVIFRAESLDAATRILAAMAGAGPGAAPVALQAWPDPGGWLLLGGSAAIALVGPNSQQIFRAVYRSPAADPRSRIPEDRGPRWRPSPAWAVALGLLAAFALAAVPGATEFVYFQF
jgi:D-alanyl-lipoteichoic acid acyltransferase DltB (MBOAT superfamily)